MPNIKPVSDLRNYNEVLRDIAVGEPVFLTKNGRGRYVLIDIEDYEKTKAAIKLLSKLSEAENSIKDEEMWISSEEVRNVLGVE
ncbi:MAG: type II toxin-antitoxin system prevent-host-death family antitoxin [Clostridium sp.]|nr:type II toxin-antitoxin system prevent-host-death family antitoxin [Clostridium sp.]MCI7442695.1 type II toxin-antitoxin system prevent-host-death family antitoxin [Clostridium sp.]